MPKTLEALDERLVVLVSCLAILLSLSLLASASWVRKAAVDGKYVGKWGGDLLHVHELR